MRQSNFDHSDWYWPFSAIVICAVAGCNSAKVEVPTAYDNWNSKDGTFALEYPAGWEAKGNGNKSSGIAWAEFDQAGARIRVDALFKEAVLGDIANMSGGVGMVDEDEASIDMTREEVMHKFNRDYYTEKYDNYTEDDGFSTRINIGPAHLSGFAAKDGFSNIKGIRATITTSDRGVTFFASCPANQWDQFKPVFIHCMESMERGVEKF